MGERQVREPGVGERGSDPGERHRRAEQHDLRALGTGRGEHPVAHARRRPEEPCVDALDGHPLRCVERRVAVRPRRQDRDPVRGQPFGERVHEGLDAAHARREVVRHDEGPGKLHRAVSSQRMSEEAVPFPEVEGSGGVAAVDRRSWRSIRVAGGDAIRWASDLLTADVAGLDPGRAVRSLLLGPTGRIRADVHVYRRDDDLVLVQDPAQPHAIDTLLAPYVLSSDVALSPAGVGPICIAPSPPGSTNGRGIPSWRPGQLSLPGDGADPGSLPTGSDLLAAPGEPLSDPVAAAVRFVDEDAVDRWRIRAGVPRFGPDLDETSFPAEAGLDAATAGVIDTDKGCFLGQEAVAKIRNFGHPPRIIRGVRSPGSSLEAGAEVHSTDDALVGVVTSAVPLSGGGSAGIARIDWRARDAALLVDGARLRVV